MNKNFVFVRLGKEAAPPPEPAQLEPKAPAADAPPAEWADATAMATDRALALDWLNHVAGDELLADVVLRSRIAEVRLAAAKRIADKAVLRRLSEYSKDKQVHRHC